MDTLWILKGQTYKYSNHLHDLLCGVSLIRIKAKYGTKKEPNRDWNAHEKGPNGLKCRRRKDQKMNWNADEEKIKYGPKCRWIKLWMRLARPRAAQARAGKWKFRQEQEEEEGGRSLLSLIISNPETSSLLSSRCGPLSTPIPTPLLDFMSRTLLYFNPPNPYWNNFELDLPLPYPTLKTHESIDVHSFQ